MKLHCLCRYCGKEWMQSAISYSPDTTRCSICGSSGEFYIRVKKAAKTVDFYGSEEGAKAQEAHDYGELPWLTED